MLTMIKTSPTTSLSSLIRWKTEEGGCGQRKAHKTIYHPRFPRSTRAPLHVLKKRNRIKEETRCFTKMMWWTCMQQLIEYDNTRLSELLHSFLCARLARNDEFHRMSS